MSTPPTTTIRLSDEDREILEKLQKLTGLDSYASVIRLSIREALGARQGFTKEKVTLPRKR